MTPSREDVFSALFALTAGVTWPDQHDLTKTKSFKTTSRRIKLFSDVPSQQQPWLGQAEHKDTISQTTNLPYKQIWNAAWLVYQSEGLNPKSTPTIENNYILDALINALAPVPADIGYPKRNTLGRLVYHAYVDGELFKDPGDIDNQGMLIVPIKLLVP
jgi:hypothetical protein